MKPEGWIRRVVAPEACGAVKRSILDACARRHGGDDSTVDRMIDRGELVRYGDKRGARWGLPRRRGGA